MFPSACILPDEFNLLGFVDPKPKGFGPASGFRSCPFRCAGGGEESLEAILILWLDEGGSHGFVKLDPAAHLHPNRGWKLRA